MTKDLNYICETMGNLSGIPVRLYKETEEVIKPLLDSLEFQQNVDLHYVFLLFFNTLDWESLFRLAFCKLLATETLLQMWKNCAENPTILIIPNMKKCF